jgi:hypothetical protein
MGDSMPSLGQNIAKSTHPICNFLQNIINFATNLSWEFWNPAVGGGGSESVGRVCHGGFARLCVSECARDESDS